MQIQGTPNERAMLVAFAYVSGFTAAFIAFGLSISDSSFNASSQISQNQAASVQFATREEQEDSLSLSGEIVSTSVDLTVVYENDGLYIYGNTDIPTLLSKNADAAGFLYESDVISNKQGFHTALPHFEYFSALNKVVFCEQYEVLGVCTPYIFDTIDQILRVFTFEGEPLVIDNQQATQLSVTSAGSFTIGDFRSASADEPWVMVLR